MAIAPNKRSIMALYAKAADPYCHRVRIVLAEKGVTYDLMDIERIAKANEELQEINPYASVPTLVDRDLVLYQSEIIMEYLDERFPHPPLMPVYPVARGRSRLMLYRINRDWYSLQDKIVKAIETNQPSVAGKARKELKEGLMSISPVFAEMPYFLSEEFSLVDCCLAPLLWRLPMLGIELPNQAKAMLSYSERIFERESFMSSLTDTEQTMRKYIQSE